MTLSLPITALVVQIQPLRQFKVISLVLLGSLYGLHEMKRGNDYKPLNYRAFIRPDNLSVQSSTWDILSHEQGC